MKVKKVISCSLLMVFFFCLLTKNSLHVVHGKTKFYSGFGNNLNQLTKGSNDSSEQIKTILSFIPGLSATVDLASAFQFLSYLGISNRNADSGSLNYISLLTTMAGISYADNSANYPAKLGMQLAFYTNDYCADQQLYIEENDYISKQVGGTVGNSYAIFPVFPINSKVNNNLCDIEVVMNNFNHNINPNRTNCSYNYNMEDEACILEGTLPILLIDYADIVASLIGIRAADCTSKGKNIKKEAEKAEQTKNTWSVVKTILSLGLKVASGVTQALTVSLATDPFTYIGKRAVGKTYEFIFEDAIEIGLIIAESIAMQNYPRAVYCPILILTLRFLSLNIMRASAQIWSRANYDRAKDSLRNTRFCGYDWFSWSNDYDYNDNNKNYIIPKLGINDNSRYKAVYECIKYGEDDPSKCAVKGLNRGYCEYSCDNILPHTRDMRNKNYREFSLLGKEVKLVNRHGNLDIEKSRDGNDNRSAAVDYDYRDCIDPRLPTKKGYESLEHRYYMRGNEKANYQCNRFFYDGKGCIMHERYMTDDTDRQNKDIKIIEYNGASYYLLDPRVVPKLVNKYYSSCNKAFQEARKCCKKRSETFVCLENVKNNEEVFCMSNVLDGNSNIAYANLVDYFKRMNSDETKITCKMDGNRIPEGFEVSKKKNTDYVCVFSKGFCPFNFRLNGGLNYRASFCDSSTLTADKKVSDESFPRNINHLNKYRCEHGYFYNENKKYGTNESISNQDYYVNTTTLEYQAFASSRGYGNANYNIFFLYDKVKDDMSGFNRNDFDIIYKDQQTKKAPDLEKDKLSGLKDMTYIDFSKYDNGNIYKIKNFCQYRAHCVEVEREQYGDDGFNNMSLFMDSSCNGKSRNSRTSTSVSLLGYTPIKQLSSPVVECVYESLSNLVKGIAGNSLCKATSTLNDDGYCDGDTGEDIVRLKKDSQIEELSSRYRSLDGELIIKGYKLPDSYSPFIKLQNYLLRTIKAMMVLFVCLFGFLKLINGKLDDIKNAFTSGTISTYAINFALVMWLAVGSGMYNVVFYKLKNLTMGAYLFMNETILSSLQSKNYLVLKQDNKVRRLKLKIRINLTNETQNYSLCFAQTRAGDILYRAKKPDGSCPFLYKEQDNFKIYVYTGKEDKEYLNNNLTLRHNQAIQNLTYFIDQQNAISIDEIFLVGVDDNGNELGRNLNSIELWNEYYDGCYFSTYEYKDGKQYLSIFDTLDCKTSRYLGFAVGEGLPNLFILAAMMMAPDLLSGIPVAGGIINLIGKLVNAVGTFFLTMMMTFFFAFMNLTIKIIFIFISSFFNLSILLFLTPLIVPFLLFEKTKGKFDTWFKEIVGAVFGPVFNITFTIILLNILDIFLYNGVYFKSFNESGRLPIMVCPSDSVSVLCFIQEVPIFGQLSKLFNNIMFLFKLVFNLFISYFIISAGEKIIDEFKGMLEKLITIDGAVSDNSLNADISGSSLSSAYSSAGSAVSIARKAADVVVRQPLSVVASAAEKYQNYVNDRFDSSKKVMSTFNSKYEKLKGTDTKSITDYRESLADEKAKIQFDKDCLKFKEAQTIVNEGRSEMLGKVGNFLNPGEAAKDALAEYDSSRGEKQGLARTYAGVFDKLFRGEFRAAVGEINNRRRSNKSEEISRIEGMSEEEFDVDNSMVHKEGKDKLFKKKAEYEGRLEAYLREHKEELDKLRGELASATDDVKKNRIQEEINEIMAGAERIELSIKDLETEVHKHTKEGKIEQLNEEKNDIGSFFPSEEEK